MRRTDSIAPTTEGRTPSTSTFSSSLALPPIRYIIERLGDTFGCISWGVKALRAGKCQAIANLEMWRCKREVLTQLKRFLDVPGFDPLTNPEKVGLVRSWLDSDDRVKKYLGCLLLVHLPVCEEVAQVVSELSSMSDPRAIDLLLSCHSQFPKKFRDPLYRAEAEGSTSARMVLLTRFDGEKACQPSEVKSKLRNTNKTVEILATKILRLMQQLTLEPSRYCTGSFEPGELRGQDPHQQRGETPDMLTLRRRDCRPDWVSLEGSLVVTDLLRRVTLLGLTSATYFPLTLGVLSAVAPKRAHELTKEVAGTLSDILSPDVVERLGRLERNTSEEIERLKRGGSSRGGNPQTHGLSWLLLAESPLGCDRFIEPQTLIDYLRRNESVIPNQKSHDRKIPGKIDADIQQVINSHKLKVGPRDLFRIMHFRELHELSSQFGKPVSLCLASSGDLGNLAVDDPQNYVDAFDPASEGQRSVEADNVLETYRRDFLTTLKACGLLHHTFGMNGNSQGTLDYRQPILYSDISSAEAAKVRVNEVISEWQKLVMYWTLRRTSPSWDDQVSGSRPEASPPGAAFKNEESESFREFFKKIEGGTDGPPKVPRRARVRA